ncbi:denticleless protein homolog [Callorhinchus milii]|uniref:denticleless protein homolog n=1 Tax=Callorhinchus milii TaxID=7868 RepID=UPI001C3FEEC1|nr:denticleless protein homolog [Callorhinchus milii]
MLFRSVLRRRVRGSAREPHSYPLESLLLHYRCIRQDEHTSSGDLGEPVPPFGCLWSTANGFHRVLAVVNEEGVVKLYETESRNRENPTLREWSAHNNAVFDVAWVPGEPKLVTASGDQTAKLWDVTGSELLGTFKGHQCSLKSVSFGDWEKAVFCTGGRDGNIMVWDTRCNKKDGFYRQVKQITGAHNALAKQTSPKQKKKRQTARGLAPSVDFQQSVTVVLFQDENTLISAGAVDGVIKVWDLRKHYSVHHQEPMPVRSFSYPGSSTRKLGYSNLILDSTGSNLFANCTDDNIYMFNLTGLRNAPVATFSGHQNSTFYVKSSLSPDGQFLLSGSSDNNAYIWKVSNPRQPPTVLQGHSQEVTSVTWCPSDFTKIATCSDDNTVRIWRLDRGTDGLEVASRGWDLVGSASRKKQLEKEAAEGPVHRTPPRAPKTPSPSLSSPRPAACVPSHGGDLPLASNTSASASPARFAGDCVSPRSGPAFSQPAPSIKTWVIQRPRARSPPPGPLGPHSARTVLGPVGQSRARSGAADPIPDRKAKRRLEAGGGDSAADRGAGEAGPVLKRSKPEARGRSSHSEGEGEAGSRRPVPSGDGGCSPSTDPGPGSPLLSSSATKLQQHKPGPESPDKENSWPHKSNWLAALGEKQRVDVGNRAGRLSSSPPASQSPPGRRQEERSAGGSPPSMRKISSYFQRKLNDERAA